MKPTPWHCTPLFADVFILVTIIILCLAGLANCHGAEPTPADIRATVIHMQALSKEQQAKLSAAEANLSAATINLVGVQHQADTLKAAYDTARIDLATARATADKLRLTLWKENAALVVLALCAVVWFFRKPIATALGIPVL